MDGSIQYRLMKPGEEAKVCRLVARAFDAFVAPGLTAQGVEEFYRYAAPRPMAERCATDHFVLLAVELGEPVGMIEMRHFDHVAMLFVERRGRGIARELLSRALGICREKCPGLERVTVHSSLFAEPVYRKLGFRATGPSRTENGITYVPMILELDRAGTDL